MRKKWLKWILWVLLTPVLLFAMLMLLLYVPPVQNFIRKQATAMASEATHMEISVERIDLRFPLNLLVRGVSVVQRPDTLLSLESLNVRIQAWPLLKGKVEVDDITLKKAAVNSSNLIEGIHVKGMLNRFFLEAHGIDLNKTEAVLNKIELDNTHIQVVLADTTETPEDTTASASKWKVNLQSLKLKNVSVDLSMPLDSTRVITHLGNVELSGLVADLKRSFYGWEKFHLSEGSIKYNLGSSDPLAGFDASHLAIHDLTLGIDSVMYYGRNMNVLIREFSMSERSGLTVTSLTGQFFADSTLIRIPTLKLLTPHSEMELTAQTYWKLIDMPTAGRLSARLDAHIGKQDVLLFAGDLPAAFQTAYPFRPLVVHAQTEGNLKQMQISRFTVDLPGAFSLRGGGELWNLTDSVTRSGNLDLEMLTQNLNFLTGLSGMPPDGSVAIPDSMRLSARFVLDGTQCTAALKLREQESLVHFDGAYDLSTEAYQANLVVDSLQIHHFLPKDSIYTLTANASVKGKGTDFTSRRTSATMEASLKQLQYGMWNIAGVDAKVRLKSSVATVHLISDNVLLKMQGDASLNLARRYLDGKMAVQVDQLDLYKLGFASRPIRQSIAFNMEAEARKDSVRMEVNAGDLDFRFQSRSTVEKLMKQSDEFTRLLTKQIEEKRLNHAALRKVLPSARMKLTAGKENPVSYFLATKDVSFTDFTLLFGFTPTRGINGRTAIHGLKVDSILLDTVFFAVRQDTARMRLQGGVINGPKNPQVVFHSTLTGEIRNEDAELTVEYIDEHGDTGVLFGVNARPLVKGRGREDGMLLKLIPAEPIVAFRKFHFEDKSNWIYLHKNMRVYADVNMDSDDGLRFRMQSNREDSVSLQNMDVELSRLNLRELSKILPYMPDLSGLFSIEANYKQTAVSLQVSAEANINNLTYERQPVGDIGMGATWLPGEHDTHYLNTYFTVNDEEVMTADGTLKRRSGKDSLDVIARLEHFPLQIANAFVPDKMVALNGDVDGSLTVNGLSEKPMVNGELALDSVSVFARQAGARYWFDNRPVQIKDNKLYFDKFAIYTTSKNPFTIDGTVNFQDMERPVANLNLAANNYTLLDAPRTRESLIYGKIFVDLRATLRGPVDGLTMRGNMNLLSSTNATYVMTNSPLLVENRLEELVTFTSFADTTTIFNGDTPSMSLGGMEMFMSMHIDNSVRLRADLNTDGSKFIELEGGGDLNMQYSRQGDINLTGRYTLSGGTMKYSLPIIPLKEFQFNSGSYVDWRGDAMNPTLNLKATERMRASVADGGDASRMVNFDVSVSIKNRLEAPELEFDIAAPEDATIQNELQVMGAEGRSKQAIAMLATGIYMNSGARGGGLTMGTALNSVLQSQINALAGSIKNASLSVDVEDHGDSESGDSQKDFSFRYSQRFFNDRVQIVLGGKVSTGSNVTNNMESFIDNISLEYRLDPSGTRYVRVFHNKNYEDVLDGEITETGIGLVLRRKMDRLGELFIFKRRKNNADSKGEAYVEGKE